MLQIHFVRRLLILLPAGLVATALAANEPTSLRLSTFTADITIPLGHRCMGVLETKAQRIDDPLAAHGLVIEGSGDPVVLVALDWCEVRNAAYAQWQAALAEAAGTSTRRVLVCSLHQHDAPVVDRGAQDYLDAVGLHGELYDVDFHAEALQRVVAAMTHSRQHSRPFTHVGVGRAKVDQIASNRRVVHDDGTIRFDRGSASGRDAVLASADVGEIDPWLRSIVFYNGTVPLAVVSCFATHPMSHYGKGAVSGDFVAIARRRRQLDTPDVKQIYLTGCSGDVTAGKYNDGSPAMRGVLCERLYDAMRRAMESVSDGDRSPLDKVEFRVAQVHLPFHDGDAFRRESLTTLLRDDAQSTKNRILAAMALSSLDRVEQNLAIDLPCLDFGPAQLVLLPGEAFVAYQLIASKIAGASQVMAVGYGECWPGYIPTERAFDEGFNLGWRWVARGSEARLRAGLTAVVRSE